jgi:hypothetical protein
MGTYTPDFVKQKNIFLCPMMKILFICSIGNPSRSGYLIDCPILLSPGAFMGKKSIDSNQDRDERNGQTDIYPDKDEDDSLYNELRELRESLAREFPDETCEISTNPIFSDDEAELVLENPGKETGRDANASQSVMKESVRHQHAGGLLKDKLEILKAEILAINRSLDGREEIEKKFSDLIDSEIKELRRQLFAIPTWLKGDKKHLEFVQLELFRQIYSLLREKRMNRVNLWKDKASERRDRRDLLFEYKSLKSLNDLEEED